MKRVDGAGVPVGELGAAVGLLLDAAAQVRATWAGRDTADREAVLQALEEAAAAVLRQAVGVAEAALARLPETTGPGPAKAGAPSEGAGKRHGAGAAAGTGAAGDGPRPLSVEGDPATAAVLRAAAALDREAARRERDVAALLLHEAALKEQASAADREQAALLLHEASLERAALTVDEVTGALVRRWGLSQLEQEVERARRGDGRLVIGFLDVDGLKHTNDRQGHAAGDALLHTVVAVIKESLRRYDVVVRYGGDEFVFSLAGASAAAARNRAKRIAAEVADRTAGSTVSIGLAALGPDEALTAVIARADADLYLHRTPAVS